MNESDPRHALFLAAIEPVQDRLYRYALAVMGDSDDAKDLTSDTILAAYEQFDSLRDPSKFLHLLLTIASRKSKRRKYRSKRFVKLEAKHAGLARVTAVEESAAELSVLLDLLQQLPVKVRETVVLFEVEDLSMKEIQRIQGGTLSGVKSRLARGRALLAALAREPEQKASLGGPAPVRQLNRASTQLVMNNPYVR